MRPNTHARWIDVQQDVAWPAQRLSSAAARLRDTRWNEGLRSVSEEDNLSFVFAGRAALRFD